MDSREREATARAVGAATAEVAATAAGVHGAIVSRVRRSVSGTEALAPVEVTVRAVGMAAAATYSVVQVVADVAGTATGVALRARTPDDAPTLSHGPRGALAVAWLGAAFGDHLAGSDAVAALAPGLSVRQDGRPVAIDDLAAAFPAATGEVWVFLHGLAGTEHQWSADYLDEVAVDGGTVVLVRYTTGRPIADNGHDLAALLAGLVSRWPVEVERLVLVGHSMGGLVARSALTQAAGATWASRVSDLVTLGAPHRGAPLERVSHRALRLLRAFEVTRPLEALGHRRSAGIKDLRFGAIVPGHWGEEHPDEVVDDPTWHVPLPPGVRHHAVVGTMAADPDGVVARVAGDGMVLPPSAAGRHEPHEDVVSTTLPRAGHMSMLDDPRVVALLREVRRREVRR